MPWCVLADVCRVLEIGNPSQAAARLDDDERHTLTTDEGISDPRVQALTIINESGLYSLILTSRKTQAKRFKKWVTAEVLPAIRKTGSYGQPVTAFDDPTTLRRLLPEYTNAAKTEEKATLTTNEGGNINGLWIAAVIGAKPRALPHFSLAPIRRGGLSASCAAATRPFRAEPSRA